MESIDMTSLEDVFHPIILTSEVQDYNVKITMTYTERIMSTPYWEMKFDGASYSTTQGAIVRNGSQISTSVELPVSWINNQFLSFSISSDLGIHYTELAYDYLRERWIDVSVPRLGIKMTVPDTFNDTEFLIKVERSEKVIDGPCFIYLRNYALLRHVDTSKGSVERTYELYSDRKEKSDRHVVKKYNIRDKHRDTESEVIMVSYCDIMDAVYYSVSPYGMINDIKLVKYTRQNSSDDAGNVNVTFVDGIYGAEDVLSFDDTFPYRSISCEAFGSTKPVVIIRNQDGQLLQTKELKQASGMTSHVIASLEDIPIDQVVGKYICTATVGNKTLDKTIEVKKVIKPEILLAEVVVNNTEEIIALCVARGQPTPEVSFTVNYAKDDKRDKLPVLETASTVKKYHTHHYNWKGGDSIDQWFKYKAERCPKPESATFKNVENDPDITQKIIVVKPLPYLSRQQVNLLYCRADGYDNVYVTKEVTSTISEILNSFMSFANKLLLMKILG